MYSSVGQYPKSEPTLTKTQTKSSPILQYTLDLAIWEMLFLYHFLKSEQPDSNDMRDGIKYVTLVIANHI